MRLEISWVKPQKCLWVCRSNTFQIWNLRSLILAKVLRDNWIIMSLMLLSPLSSNQSLFSSRLICRVYYKTILMLLKPHRQLRENHLTRQKILCLLLRLISCQIILWQRPQNRPKKVSLKTKYPKQLNLKTFLKNNL